MLLPLQVHQTSTKSYTLCSISLGLCLLKDIILTLKSVVIILTETDIVRMCIQLVIIRVEVIVSGRVLAIIDC